MKQCVLLLITILFVSSTVLAQDTLDADALDALLDDYISQDTPGAVVYVETENDVWMGARGLANVEQAITLQTDDLFRIASITKPLVATVVLQLVDEGQIELDAPIVDYLPDDISDNIDNVRQATVRQMLQMTSGIFDYSESDAFNDAVEENPTYAWTAQETITMIYGEPAYFEAGTDYAYSNSNYNLAQIIIESVTGNSLADELQNRIFAPVGMDQCVLETPDRFARDIVRGYEDWGDGEFVDVTEVNDGVGLGDGGVICDAQSLAQFPIALIYGNLLAEEILIEMFDTVDDGAGGQYGLGIGYEDGDYGEVIGHDGATSGFQSNMIYLPDEDVVVVVLTNNFDSEIVEDLTLDALAIALDSVDE